MNLYGFVFVYYSEKLFEIRTSEGGDCLKEFEYLLEQVKPAVERFVYFRISMKADAEDVLQDIYITAYKSFDSLRERSAFRSWIFAIARNKCKDYFAALAGRMELPLEEEERKLPAFGRCPGPDMRYERNPLRDSVHDTLEKLKDKDKQILYLYFFRELPQVDIARILDIPLGTVKSRLHTAKENFKNNYPVLAQQKEKAYKVSEKFLNQAEQNRYGLENELIRKKMEEVIMKHFPEFTPEYKIEQLDKAPFPVRWEELLGWFLVPRLGEKTSFAIYDRPDGKCSWVHHNEVVGEAEVHGLRGVEIVCKSWDYREEKEGLYPPKQEPERILVAQLTDTHCRYLASTEKINGVTRYTTFLDGDEFTGNWGFGEENCGKEVNITPKGDVVRNGSEITFTDKKYLLDVVGRYMVTMNGKAYDTICVMDIEANVNGTVTEQFIDENGRTVLWRIYCQNDFLFPKYQKLWTEMLPDSETLSVNGLTYVHWYDCITDYIL